MHYENFGRKTKKQGKNKAYGLDGDGDDDGMIRVTNGFFLGKERL